MDSTALQAQILNLRWLNPRQRSEPENPGGDEPTRSAAAVEIRERKDKFTFGKLEESEKLDGVEM